MRHLTLIREGYAFKNLAIIIKKYYNQMYHGELSNEKKC